MVTKKSETLWNEVRQLKMSMYGLNPQPIENFYESLPVDPKALYLRLKKANATAAVSALEVALNPHPDPNKQVYDVVAAEGGLLVITKKLDVTDIVKNLDQAREEETQAKMEAQEAAKKS